MDEGEDEALERLKKLDHIMHSGKLEGTQFMSNDNTTPGVLLMLETFKDDAQNFNLSIFDFTATKEQEPTIATVIAYGLLSILDENCDMVASKGFDFIEKVQDRRLDVVSKADVVSFADYKKMANSEDVALPMSSNYTFKDKKEKKDNGEDDAS